jgi:hypothetical protein
MARAHDEAAALIERDPHLRESGNACIRKYFDRSFKGLLDLAAIS